MRGLLYRKKMNHTHTRKTELKASYTGLKNVYDWRVLNYNYRVIISLSFIFLYPFEVFLKIALKTRNSSRITLKELHFKKVLFFIYLKGILWIRYSSHGKSVWSHAYTSKNDFYSAIHFFCQFFAQKHTKFLTT